MKKIRTYIEKWRDSPQEYELQHMLREAMNDAYQAGIDEAIRIIKEEASMEYSRKKKA